MGAAVYPRPGPAFGLCYDAPAVGQGLLRRRRTIATMANSKQQRKRVRVAARQRLENLRYRSQIKTLFRRLGEALDAGDGERVDEVHRRLTALVDRAAARRAIHRNTAARRKSQAARLVTRAKSAA
jgi:small subunit ribosomal protein S20